MRSIVLIAAASLAAGCSAGADPPQERADRPPGTTVRIAGNGAELQAEGAGIRVGRNGVEIDLDRDVELNVGELRARVRSGEEGSLAVAADER